MITVVITSCGRIDLLKKTIQSFNRYNTFPHIAEMIVVDDSGDTKKQGEIGRYLFDEGLKVRYGIKFLPNEVNIGQVRSIDKAYAEVKTPWIFHCEEDWEFYRHGFIEKSLDVLSDPNVITVWLRELHDTNGQPIEKEILTASGGTQYHLVSILYQGIWSGFTWNPGLRRKADYDLVKPFESFGLEHGAAVTECHIGQEYFKRGFRAAILTEGYVKHTGWGELSTRQ